MAPGGATFGRLREVDGRNASESTSTPCLDPEPEHFVTACFETVGGGASRKGANQTSVKEVTMPEETGLVKAEKAVGKKPLVVIMDKSKGDKFMVG